LKKSFFDIVNEMRLEEAKNKLRSLGDNYTIDSVADECGFSSGRSFFRAFQKHEKTTPARWIERELKSRI
jgi:AraC-like DNA-binding protein